MIFTVSKDNPCSGCGVTEMKDICGQCALRSTDEPTTPPSAGELTVDLDSLATEKEIESEWYGRRLKPYGKSCRMAYTIQQMAKLLEEWNKSQTPTTRMLISRVELEDLWTKTAALLRRYKGEQP